MFSLSQGKFQVPLLWHTNQGQLSPEQNGRNALADAPATCHAHQTVSSDWLLVMT